MEEVEKLLGRKLKANEKVIYDIYKDDKSYKISKDGRGNLMFCKL